MTELNRWLEARYGLSVDAISPLRTLTNEVFSVVAGDDRFALKVYGPGWRTPVEVDWELHLLNHLAEHGHLVPVPRAGRDGRQQQLWQGRPATLSPWLPGVKPQPPFVPELYRVEGASIAALHATLDSFTPDRGAQRRAALDLEGLVRRPWGRLRAMVAPQSQPLLDALAPQVRTIMAALDDLPLDELDWGPVHGDVTYDNVHLTGDGSDPGHFVWYDFDSGGPGYRALDVQGWASQHPECQPRFEAFVAGYRAHRILSEVNVAAAPWLDLANEVWGLWVDHRRLTAVTGSAPDHQAVDDLLRAVHSRFDERLAQLR